MSGVDTLVLRTRERASRILEKNSSLSAKALARDALELCDLVSEYRDELLESRAAQPEAVSPDGRAEASVG